jgi:hypothetical protein
MDEASRMARAKEMGFRDMNLYHGNSSMKQAKNQEFTGEKCHRHANS